jgi:hypothetical protein
MEGVGRQRAFEGVDGRAGAFDLGRCVRRQPRHAQHGLDQPTDALCEADQDLERAVSELGGLRHEA